MAVSLQRWDLPFEISAFFQHILMIRIHVTMLNTTDSASRCDDMTLAKIQKLLSLNGWENVMDGDKLTFHEIWRMGSEIVIKWSCTLQNRKRMKDMKGKIRHYHEDFWEKILNKNPKWFELATKFGILLPTQVQYNHMPMICDDCQILQSLVWSKNSGITHQLVMC